MKRRQFLVNSLSIAALASLSTVKNSFAVDLPDPDVSLPEEKPQLPPKNSVELINSGGAAVKISSLKVGQAQLFFYPFVSTPAILVNLGTSVSAQPLVKSKLGDYSWKGGCGPRNNFVAFSAICPHDLIYPTKELNLVTYRHNKSGYYAPQDKLITCCSHGTAYDTLKGGKPILGPSKVPLTAIKLDYNAQNDTLKPVGFDGHNIFPTFLRKNSKALARQFGYKAYRQPADGDWHLTALDSFSEKQVRCS